MEEEIVRRRSSHLSECWLTESEVILWSLRVECNDVEGGSVPLCRREEQPRMTRMMVNTLI